MAENIKKVDIVQAINDEEYRISLTSEQSEHLAPTPADDTALSDEELDDVSGGLLTNTSHRVNTLTFSSNATGKS